MRPTVVTLGLGDALLVTQGYGGSSTIGFVGWTEGLCQGAAWTEGTCQAAVWGEGAGAATTWSEPATTATPWTEGAAPPIASPGSPTEWKEGGI